MGDLQSGSLTAVRETLGGERAVVFLHGFTGDRDDTWDRFPSLLGTALPDWDVFTLGYATTFLPDLPGWWSGDPDLPLLVGRYKTELTIEPLNGYGSLVLIAHSMGGLVVQRALVDDADLCERVRCVLLFGTPSGGLRRASSWKLWKRQVRNMAADGPFIRDLRDRWDSRFGSEPPFRMRVVAGSKDRFVPPESSLGPFDGKLHKVVPGDHTSIVKPAAGDATSVRLAVTAILGTEERERAESTRPTEKVSGPDAPVIVGPAEGRDVLSKFAFPLQWDFPEELEGTRGGYELEIGPRPDLEGADLWSSPAPELSLTEVLPSDGDQGLRSPEGRIFWRVRALLPDGSRTGWSETASFFFFFDSLERIERRRKLTFGTSDSSMGVFSKRIRGEWVGIDIEVARQIIQDLKHRIPALDDEPDIRDISWYYDEGHERYEIVHHPNERLGPNHPLEHKRIRLLDEMLGEQQVDLVLSGMSRTRAREYDYDLRFSEPYYASRQCLMVEPGGPIGSVREAVGARLGAQGGTTNSRMAAYLRTISEEYTGRNTADRMIADLEAGELDGVLLDEPFAYWKNQQIGWKYKVLVIEARELEALAAAGVVDGACSPEEEYAVALHEKDERLLEAVDSTIRRLHDGGQLKQLRDRFVPRPPA